ncbi:MAG TPA: bifunctional acetate--CoA ligase family protein/GNAT family N-acetyltransferase [Xanthobacteraceae bacterium]
MSTYRLDKLFRPQSVAMVGANPREKSVGRAVLRNLRAAGLDGPIYLVNPDFAEIDGMRAVRSLAALPSAPEVVVIATPPDTVPGIVAQAAELGTCAAIIVTAGLGHGPGSLCDAAAKAARAKGLRLVGPNCLGVIVPAARLNASFAARMPGAGDLALISQSGGMVAGMVEWAARRSIGFSAIISIGDQIDVDIGDLVDYFALDHRTRAILLYVEELRDARKFMSAARAAARIKPVVVIKAGRHAEAAKAAATHTGALAGADAVYDAALRRAGLLRVFDLAEFFDAAETLGRVRAARGKRLAILTNGGGIGVLAIDRLIDLGGVPAEISAETRAKLDAVLPSTWSKVNPIDIVGDADAARYCAALDALLDDGENDAVLVVNVETALASGVETANAVVDFLKSRRGRMVNPKAALALWVGAGEQVTAVFDRANIPHFATESDAVQGFMHLVRHGEAVSTLMETPPSLPEHFAPDRAAARALVEHALLEHRSWLDPLEAGKLLEAYAIPMVPTVLAATPQQAETLAAPFFGDGRSVVVKIASRDIVHKSDVNGVRLNLADGAAVRKAAADVIARAIAARPDARIAGVTIQPMIVRPKAHELIAGIAEDATFGPVVLFGHGGTAVHVIDDTALALPPLDLKMANDLIARTRVARMLHGYRGVPAARVDDIALVLVKLAQLRADLPEIRELDINPLIADETGVLALDARIAIARVPVSPSGRRRSGFAVRPYPIEWERHVTVGEDWRVFVRPMRPEDEDMVRDFLQHVSLDDLRLRFFAPIKDFGHVFVARLTQLDYARAMAFVAIDETTRAMLGGVRLHSDANYESGEYAVLLRSDLKGRGLGWKLMQMIIEYARAEGLKRIEGQVLGENATMLRMCRELGFSIEREPDSGDIQKVVLELG